MAVGTDIREQDAPADFGALATAAGPIQGPPVIKTTTPDFDAGAQLQTSMRDLETARANRDAAALQEQSVRDQAAQASAHGAQQATGVIQGQQPKIDTALAGVQQAQQAYEGQPQPPSRQLTDFLSPVAGESPDNTISKLIHGISLIATGWTGLARGDATAALASLSGALKGWHEGDKVRADRAFADWKAQSEKLLANWDMRHKSYQDILENTKLTTDQQLKMLELARVANGDQVAAAVARTQGIDANIKGLTADRQMYWDMVKETMTLENQQTLANIKAGNQLLNRQDVYADLLNKGWRPTDPEWNTHYLNAVKNQTAQGVGTVGSAQLIPFKPGTPGAPSGATTPGTMPQTPGGITPLIPVPPQPGDTTSYIHKETLQHPPAGMPPQQYQNSGDYVAIEKAALPKFQQMRSVGTMLSTMEQTIKDRPDIWPTKAGDVPAARLKYKALTEDWSPIARTDPAIGAFESNKIALPNAVKAFGDVGNISGSERAISQTASGFGGASRDEALARIDNIRKLLNGGLETSGVTFRFKSGGDKAKKVIRMPSGLTLEVD